MPDNNQIINMNEENLEETSDTDVAPDLSIEKSADVSANESIEKTCNILGDDNDNVLAPEEIVPAEVTTALQLEEENTEEETLDE